MACVNSSSAPDLKSQHQIFSSTCLASVPGSYENEDPGDSADAERFSHLRRFSCDSRDDARQLLLFQAVCSDPPNILALHSTNKPPQLRITTETNAVSMGARPHGNHWDSVSRK